MYHFHVTAISRSKGRTATAAAAYRAADKILDERSGNIHDYTKKKGVESTTLIFPSGVNLPLPERSQLWNAAEKAENRKDNKCTVAREYEIALPAGLSADKRRELAHELGKHIADRYGVAVGR